MLAERWRLNGSVALRPEPFGALAYDFTTRRLSFLTSRRLVEIVRDLGNSATVGDALDRAGVTGSERAQCLSALHTLARTGMLAREDTP